MNLTKKIATFLLPIIFIGCACYALFVKSDGIKEEEIPLKSGGAIDVLTQGEKILDGDFIYTDSSGVKYVGKIVNGKCVELKLAD
jgi:hypothetical protein